MNYITCYHRTLLVMICLCMFLLMSACGSPGASIVTPNVNTGEQIAQPTPSESPFPVHHYPTSNSAP